MTDEFDRATVLDRGGREVSTISFPYVDLDEAVKVAKAMHEVGGGVPMDRDQVASAMRHAPGGAFANKLSAAKQFGLIDSQQGRWSLTPLGFEVIEPGREAAAKAEAFLNVELYRRTFDEFRSKMLPGKGGLENAFVTFGVAVKQKEKARQTFERSARSAGFFPNGTEDRLVQPVIGASARRPVEESEAPSQTQVAAPVAATTVPAGLNPFIQGLLTELPAAKSDWSTADRVKWLQAAAQIFDLIYEGGDGPVVVQAKSSSST